MNGGLYTLYTIDFQGGLLKQPVDDLSANTSKLIGGSRSFFLQTGANGTQILASASASASNINFSAKLGPFGLFVNGGSAAIGGDIRVGLDDITGDGRLVLVGYDGSGVTSDLGNILNFLAINTPVAVFERQAGDSTKDEVQAVTPLGSGGKFKLQFTDGAAQVTTADIDFNAPAFDPANTNSNTVLAKLRAALTTAGKPTSDVKSVLQFGNTYLITFAGAIGGGLSFVTPSGITGVAGAITFKGTANNAGCVSPPEVACLDLPIFVGTQSSQVPIDFQDGNSGAGGMSISTTNTTSGAIVTATIDVRAKSGFYTLELLDTNGTSQTTANLQWNADPSTGSGNLKGALNTTIAQLFPTAACLPTPP